jgi:hypothetical protein
MILVTFTRQALPDGKPVLDFVHLDTIDELPSWLQGMGTRLTFSLVKKKRRLTQEGWEKNTVLAANLIQIIDDGSQMLVNVKKIVSGSGILFEDVKHCSEQIVDLMALKCIIQV